MVNLSWLDLVIGKLRARVADINDLTVTNSATLAEGVSTTGFPTDGVVGDYGSPAHTATVTLTTGQQPAGSINLGHRATMVLAEGQTQESGLTLDDDLFAIPEDTDADGNTIVNVYWDGSDPGADETLDYTAHKTL